MLSSKLTWQYSLLLSPLSSVPPQLDSPSFGLQADLPSVSIGPAQATAAYAGPASAAAAAANATAEALVAASASGALSAELRTAGALQPWGTAVLTGPPTYTTTMQARAADFDAKCCAVAYTLHAV